MSSENHVWDKQQKKALEDKSNCDQCGEIFNNDLLMEFLFIENRKHIFVCENCCEKLEEDNWGGRVL